MKITIKNIDWTPTLEALALKALRQGAATNPTPDGVEYPIDDAKISQVELNALLLEPCTIDDAVVYVKVLSSVLDNLVDVDLPDSKYIDENDVEQRRQYQEYAMWHKYSADGTEVLMRCCHAPYTGPKCGVPWTEAEMLLWQSEVGELICENEYNRIMATDEWKPAEVTE